MERVINILVVEDHPLQIAAFKTFSEINVGLQFVFAKTYKEYEKLSSENDFDLILTDLFFPYSYDEENESQNAELWVSTTRKIFEKYHTGSSCMMSFRKWEGDPRKQESWAEMRACESMSEWTSLDSFKFFAKKQKKLLADNLEVFQNLSLDKIKENLEKNRKSVIEKSDFDSYCKFRKECEGAEGFTAPWGYKVFMKEYYENNKPVVLVTSGSAHGSIGSPFLMLMQHEGMDNYGYLPFMNLDGDYDLRLSHLNESKPLCIFDKDVSGITFLDGGRKMRNWSATTIERVVASGLVLRKLMQQKNQEELEDAILAIQFLESDQDGVGIGIERGDVVLGYNFGTLDEMRAYVKPLLNGKSEYYQKRARILEQDINELFSICRVYNPDLKEKVIKGLDVLRKTFF